MSRLVIVINVFHILTGKSKPITITGIFLRDYYFARERKCPPLPKVLSINDDNLIVY